MYLLNNKKFLKVFLFLALGILLGQIYRHFFVVSSHPTLSKNISNDDKNPVKQKKEKQNNKIQVRITGAVQKPGTYFMKKGSRLYTLIQKAGGFKNGARKKIKNYYLKNGSEFTIKYRRIIEVSIFGEVKNPGFYKMYSGSRAYDLVKKAGGITGEGILSFPNFYLKFGKKITVPRKIFVTIKGEVRYPGTYTLASRSRLKELIRLAGGLNPLAKPPRANYFLKDGQVFFIKKIK